MTMSRPFRFKQFLIVQERTPMKVGTDGVLLGAWAEGGRRILDIGTGTGLVALMMAQRFPEAVVLGIDISDEAVEESSYNVHMSPFGNRVRILRQDFRTMACDAKYDAIVCNPPYFGNSLKCPEKGRSMARHSDTLPLAELMKKSGEMLMNGGVFNIVIPYSQTDEALAEAKMCGFAVRRAMRVRGAEGAEWKRVLLSFELKGGEREWAMEEMTLECERGVRSGAYRKLTEEFYLDN